jgi:Flp pilus assembly protein TadG
MKRGIKRCCQNRRGTTVVETALVLPVYLMLVLAMVELGHALLVQHVLNSACRQAARIGSTQGNTTAQVQAKVLAVLGSTVPASKVSVFVKDAGAFDTGGATTSTTALESMPAIELSAANPRQLFMVRAKINYKDIAIVPNVPILGKFLSTAIIQGQAFTRHE